MYKKYVFFTLYVLMRKENLSEWHYLETIQNNKQPSWLTTDAQFGLSQKIALSVLVIITFLGDNEFRVLQEPSKDTLNQINQINQINQVSPWSWINSYLVSWMALADTSTIRSPSDNTKFRSDN